MADEDEQEQEEKEPEDESGEEEEEEPEEDPEEREDYHDDDVEETQVGCCHVERSRCASNKPCSPAYVRILCLSAPQLSKHLLSRVCLVVGTWRMLCCALLFRYGSKIPHHMHVKI